MLRFLLMILPLIDVMRFISFELLMPQDSVPPAECSGWLRLKLYSFLPDDVDFIPVNTIISPATGLLPYAERDQQLRYNPSSSNILVAFSPRAFKLVVTFDQDDVNESRTSSK